MTDIQKQILRIIAFYDVFEFPLTGEEIWLEVQSSKFKVQSEGAEYSDVMTELQGMMTGGVLEKEEVFYCLKGRISIVKQRKMRYPESLRKILKSQKWIRLLRCLPFVRNIYFAGSVAMENARRESDIDLVIVSKKGRAWSSRFFVNSVLALISMRVHGRHWVGKNIVAYFMRLFGFEGDTVDSTRGKNTLCTAFFIDESVDPKTVLPGDPQFQFWVARWLSTQVKGERSKVKDFFEHILSIVPERLFRWGQERVLMPESLRKLALVDNGDVIFNDTVIKLHSVDRRRGYNKAYLDRLKTLNV